MPRSPRQAREGDVAEDEAFSAQLSALGLCFRAVRADGERRAGGDMGPKAPQQFSAWLTRNTTGNCLFRSLPDQMEGDESLHPTYRVVRPAATGVSPPS